MGSLVAAAQQLAETAAAAPGVRAYVDPAKAAANRPCVLVAPPTIDYVARANRWRVVLLASKPLGSLAALAELDELLQSVQPTLDVERAEPAAYNLTPETGPLPAYLLTVTT